jgi:hypothetical protein
MKQDKVLRGKGDVAQSRESEGSSKLFAREMSEHFGVVCMFTGEGESVHQFL